MNKEEVLELIKNHNCHFSLMIKHNNNPFYDEINKIKGDKFSEKLYRWLHADIENLGQCAECKQDTYFIGINDGFREFCTIQCMNSGPIMKKRIEDGTFKKYGVKNVSQSDEIKLKKEQTSIANYGEGIKCAFNRKDVKEKASIKWHEHFEANREELLTNLNRKRKEAFIRDCIEGDRLDKSIEPLFDIDTFTSIKDPNLQFRCRDCGTVFCHHLQWGVKPKCYVCNPNSKLQVAIAEYIISKGIKIKQNVRNLIYMEIDIYIPELKIAIECNGDYWHSTKRKKKNYHLGKTKRCENKGIKLIHIFETEWNTNTEEIKNILDNIINNKHIDEMIEKYKTIDGFYLIDRKIYNKCFFNENYKIIEEIEPKQCNYSENIVWDCGMLKLIKL